MDVYETLTFRERAEWNHYLGRGIILGLDSSGKTAVSAYFIMGRSENSRNRIFEKNFDSLVIKPFDESKVEDPSLIIYYPLRSLGTNLIVTNGDQTDTILYAIDEGPDFFERALRTREFEPDAPNWTPRISGLMNLKTGDYKMSILKSADPAGTKCNRFFYEYAGLPGLGHFLHTYVNDGNPLPTFVGEPERIIIPDDIDAFTEEIWDSLNTENRISLYVRYTDMRTGEYKDRLINRHEV